MPLKVISINKGSKGKAGLTPTMQSDDGRAIKLRSPISSLHPAYFKDVAPLASDVYLTSEIDKTVEEIGREIEKIKSDCGIAISESLLKIQLDIRRMKKTIVEDKPFREMVRQELLMDKSFRSLLKDEILDELKNDLEAE